MVLVWTIGGAGLGYAECGLVSFIEGQYGEAVPPFQVHSDGGLAEDGEADSEDAGLVGVGHGLAVGGGECCAEGGRDHDGEAEGLFLAAGDGAEAAGDGVDGGGHPELVGEADAGALGAGFAVDDDEGAAGLLGDEAEGEGDACAELDIVGFGAPAPGGGVDGALDGSTGGGAVVEAVVEPGFGNAGLGGHDADGAVEVLGLASVFQVGDDGPMQAEPFGQLGPGDFGDGDFAGEAQLFAGLHGWTMTRQIVLDCS